MYADQLHTVLADALRADSVRLDWLDHDPRDKPTALLEAAMAVFYTGHALFHEMDSTHALTDREDDVRAMYCPSLRELSRKLVDLGHAVVAYKPFEDLTAEDAEQDYLRDAYEPAKEGTVKDGW